MVEYNVANVDVVGSNPIVRSILLCFSGCTVIFQAGKRRIAHESASFLYHYGIVTELIID